MNPYIVRFISIESKKGKTSIASRVIEILKKRGFVVGAIKHAVHRLDLSEKDSYRYLEVGSDVVAVSSKDLLIIYKPRWVDDLAKVVEEIRTPIVVVEGFKRSRLGDAIAVVDDVDELEELLKITNVVAVATDSDRVREVAVDRGLSVFSKNSVAELADFVESKAINYIENQLPKTNCGYCGYSSCRAFAYAYLKGKESTCPVISIAKLVVDGREVPMNPFVKRVLQLVVKGFMDSLKGIPSIRRRVVIELEY
ncbi:MAG TPA: hypothetical protein ENF93_00185 [Ignisphaera sp.]|nr:hypothetical protein [Ignisphaera sp.]